MTLCKDETPIRPDAMMDRLHAANAAKCRANGLDPRALPWHWVGGVLIDNATGRPLAYQYDYDPKQGHAPYFDRWRHREPGQ